MSGPDIFISYCRQERAVARLFAESFAHEGLNVWWDAVLHSGETFDEVIERNLRAAKAVVVLWSPQSVTSRWVRAEATQADRANKLVPVIIEACNLPIIFELTHTTDLAGWDGDRSDHRWQSLIHDLRRLVGPAEVETPVVQEQASPPAQASGKPAAEVRESQPPAVVAREPASQDEVAAGKKPMAADEEELFKALERLAKRREAAMQKAAPAESSEEKFFREADAFREQEGDVAHCLRRVHGVDSEALHVVTSKGVKIGRTAPADIVVVDPSVSREHCIVELAADKLRVTDLNSTNGTYIDNKRIGRAETLPVGSVLRVGTVSFEHEVQSRADAQRQDGKRGMGQAGGAHDARIARSS